MTAARPAAATLATPWTMFAAGNELPFPVGEGAFVPPRTVRSRLRRSTSDTKGRKDKCSCTATPCRETSVLDALDSPNTNRDLTP